MSHRLKNLFKPNVDPINKIYIRKKNILYNYDYLKSLQPNASLFPVLKSNAYWHGLELMTKILDKTDAEYLVVDSFPEYQIVKKNSKKKILLLGETLPKNYKKFDFNRTTFCVYNIETISYLAKLKKNINIHIFVDTWMHREWVNEEELINILEFLKNYKKINIEWVLSHFHSADNVNNTNILKQIQKFKDMYHIIVDYWYTPQRKHIWNSEWIFKMKDDFFNAFRPGLSLYWYTCLHKDDPYYSLTTKLKPAMTVYSRIVSIHSIPQWDWVSYNHTRKAASDQNIATIPFWYFEWLPVSASNHIKFKYKRDFMDQIWNICMNLCSFQINDGKIWEKVEIIWVEWKNTISELAKNSNKIIYEILISFDKNIRREVI